jgi:hypothetical protein
MAPGNAEHECRVPTRRGLPPRTGIALPPPQGRLCGPPVMWSAVGLGGLGDGDGVAEGFELADVIACLAALVGSGLVVAGCARLQGRSAETAAWRTRQHPYRDRRARPGPAPADSHKPAGGSSSRTSTSPNNDACAGTSGTHEPAAQPPDHQPTTPSGRRPRRCSPSGSPTTSPRRPRSSPRSTTTRCSVVSANSPSARRYLSRTWPAGCLPSDDMQ